MSLENHSLNSSCESNNVGIIKCSRAQSWKQRKSEVAKGQQNDSIWGYNEGYERVKVVGMCVSIDRYMCIWETEDKECKHMPHQPTVIL